MQDLNTPFYLYINTHSHTFPREAFPLLPNSHLLLLSVMCVSFVTTFTLHFASIWCVRCSQNPNAKQAPQNPQNPKPV